MTDTLLTSKEETISDLQLEHTRRRYSLASEHHDHWVQIALIELQERRAKESAPETSLDERIAILGSDLAIAVANDEAPEEGGFDLSAGMFGRHVSAWIRKLAGSPEETSCYPSDELSPTSGPDLSEKALVCPDWGDYHNFIDNVCSCGAEKASAPHEMASRLIVSKEEARSPLSFRHWSKDPLVPYRDCHCDTCAESRNAQNGKADSGKP